MTPATLMLAYALTIAALAGSTGVGWAIVLALPHLVAYAYLKGGDNARTTQGR